MLACRLCLEFGEQDPEQWLENCPRRVLNIWRAYYANEPWGNELELLAKIMATLKRMVAMEVSGEHTQQLLDGIDAIASFSIAPEWIGRKDIAEPTDSIASTQAALEAQFGHNN